MTLSQEFLDLITLTKQYICQEYKTENHGQTKKEWVTTDPDTYAFFKEYAGKSKKTEVVNQVNEPQTPSFKTCLKAYIQKPEKPSLMIKESEVNNVENTPEKVIDEKRQFVLEPLAKTLQEDLTDIKKMVVNLLPHEIILEEISDQPYILIISDTRNKKVSCFLENLTKALDITVATTKLITSKKFHEKKPFSNLKMIIQTNALEDLTVFGVCHLEFKMSEEIFKDPQKKVELWNTILHTFTK